MSRPKLEVADVFRRYGEAWRVDNAAHLNRGQRRVMTAIEICRTAALGGHVECHCQSFSPCQRGRRGAFSFCAVVHVGHDALTAEHAKRAALDFFDLPRPRVALSQRARIIVRVRRCWRAVGHAASVRR